MAGFDAMEKFDAAEERQLYKKLARRLLQLTIFAFALMLVFAFEFVP